LRVSALPGLALRPGDAVALEIPVTACVPLSEADL
jgi:hypothetical protein